MSLVPLFHGEGLGKNYITPVLSDVSLELREGEVLALTGENGAGKSTLTKIIAGLVRPNDGRMHLHGKPYSPASRHEAEKQGVRMVLQELGLIPTLTVAENLLLDHMPSLGGFVRREELNRQAARQMAIIGLEDLDPRTRVGQLGVGHQQMVEIARNLVGDCRLLILDEPTAMLTSREIDHLFAQILALKQRGVGIIYISHRLDELQQVADRVMVLRDGRHIDTRAMGEVVQNDIVRLMVGHAVDEDRKRPLRDAGKVAMEVRGLGRAKVVQEVSFTLHEGEILGLAGLVGAGRTELLRLIYGADPKDSGDVYLNGSESPARLASPMSAVRQGIGLVTEDRKSQGLLLPLAIRINATLANIRAISRRGWLKPAAERAQVNHLHDALGVKSRSIDQPVGELSGGNQQKVVFARWLHRDCKVLLLDEPTRGVDISARSDIYFQMERLADAGKAMLMVSSDLRELMFVCDRIAVMSAGRLVQVFKRGEWTQQSLLEAAFSGYLGTGANGASEAALPKP
jgi:ribose transport system ATP-binding protein